MTSGMSRRRFLTAGGAACAGLTLLPRTVWGANARLNIAFVGAGRKGAHAIKSLSPVEEVNLLAFADVNKKACQESVDAHPKVPFYTDFREMMDKHGKEIDGVVVSTPDHFHHYATKYCMKMSKGVYVEKPMCHTIAQVRDLKEAELKLGVACQMGNQGHSYAGGAWTARAWYEAGILGEVPEVACWLNGNRSGGEDVIPPKQPVPDYITWDVWLGPSKPYDYNDIYFTSGNWRAYTMFGEGGLGDMGCHTFNMAVYVLDLDWPEEIQVTSERPSRFTYPPKGFQLTYTFPRNEKRGPVILKYYMGDHKVPRPENLEPERKMIGSDMGGCFLFGSKQTLETDSHCRRSQIIPEVKRKAVYEECQKHKPAIKGSHYGNWLNAIKGQEKCRSNFQYASRLTEIVLLGDIASRLNRKLKLDPVNRTIVGDDEAVRMMNGEAPREGWNV